MRFPILEPLFGAKRGWLRPSTDLVLGGLAGVLLFFALSGGRIVDPRNVGWVLEGDPAMHFLGWHFFRHEPWSWPPGRIERLGIPEGTSIVFTDSIPAMALGGKLVAGALPPEVQYQGAWLLLALVMQGVFAARLVRFLSPGPLVGTLLVGFFVLSPTLLQRLRHHHALAGQGLLLAALGLYLMPPRQRRGLSWGALLVAAVLVHGYLAAMVGLVFLADALRGRLEREEGTARLLGRLAATGSALAVTGFLAGYFVLPAASVGEGGFALYSTNLLALFDGGLQSRFLPAIAHATEGQYEGRAYLGAGLLLLAVAIPVLRLVRGTAAGREGRAESAEGESPRVRWAPLVAVSLGALVFALSSTVTFAGWKIEVPFLRHAFGPAADAFRASGRFVWIPYYLLWIVLFLGFWRASRGRESLRWPILALALAVQAVDLGPQLGRLHSRHAAATAAYTSPLVDRRWEEVGGRVDRVLVFPLEDQWKFWLPFGVWAAPRHLAINAAARTRHDAARAAEEARTLEGRLWSGEVEPKALIVTGNRTVFEALRPRIEGGGRVEFFEADGFFVIAPTGKAGP